MVTDRTCLITTPEEALTLAEVMLATSVWRSARDQRHDRRHPRRLLAVRYFDCDGAGQSDLSDTSLAIAMTLVTRSK